MPNGVALPSIQHALPSRTARTERLLARPPGADEDQQMEMPLGKGAQILLQPLIGRQMQHLMRLSPAAFFRGRHGVSPAVVRDAWKGRIRALQGDSFSFRLLDLPHGSRDLKWTFRRKHKSRFF